MTGALPPRLNFFFFLVFCNFLLGCLPPTLNAVDINPKKPAKPAIGAPTIIPIPLRQTAVPLVDNTADVTPVTTYVE